MNVNSPQILECKLCLYKTSHPLGLTINRNGICSGCEIHNEKNSLNWQSRFNKLKKIISPYKSKSGKTYDCVIPVTGANDSYFTIHVAKNLLGLNPLLVHYNKYFNTPLGIRNLANLKIKFNCDLLTQNVNPISVKKITKTTLREFGSIYWHCHAGHTVFPVQIAEKFKIPLIIWGAHQGIEQVGMFSHEHEVEMSRRYRKDHDLMGHEADDLLSIFDTLSESDIWQYRYPDNNAINKIGIRGIYLGNYIRWDPKSQHELMIKNYEYQTAKFHRTFDTYDHVDCFNYMDLHDLIKMHKHGYSKVTDHACREIRHNRLTKENAKKIVAYYESQPIKFSSLFCEWLGIDPNSLKFILDLHKKHDFNESNSKKKINLNSMNFLSNNLISASQENKYITVGKGFIN